MPRDVPRHILAAGRALSVVVAGIAIAAGKWDFYLPIAVGMIWVPNYMGVVANRWILASPRHRPLVPWATFVIGWVGLTLSFLT